MNNIKKSLLPLGSLLMLFMTAAMYTVAQEPAEERPAPRRPSFQRGPRIISPEIRTKTFSLQAALSCPDRLKMSLSA